MSKQSATMDSTFKESQGTGGSSRSNDSQHRAAVVQHRPRRLMNVPSPPPGWRTHKTTGSQRSATRRRPELAEPGNSPEGHSHTSGVLVVAQEESFSAAALVAAHHVDTDLLASAVAFGALIHICRRTKQN
ncbi:hypothetical protein EYF80_016659 [Liparis tanakae]|uniref:Uncharacterized protein n=1 Tax=Liparis tanakae TaxID=230148 RepID=A0A4Z2I7M4_9TELE|nr:hypothetical protein EYF80_016659 [Liparis tanakae]